MAGGYDGRAANCNCFACWPRVRLTLLLQVGIRFAAQTENQLFRCSETVSYLALAASRASVSGRLTCGLFARLRDGQLTMSSIFSQRFALIRPGLSLSIRDAPRG